MCNTCDLTKKKKEFVKNMLPKHQSVLIKINKYTAKIIKEYKSLKIIMQFLYQCTV